MGKSLAGKQYFTFVKGLNTEAGPLTYPADTWADGDNAVPQLDGSINKRASVDFESDYVLSGNVDTLANEAAQAYTIGEWNTVGGDGSLNFFVVQRGRFVRFYLNTGNNVSGTEQSFSIDLNTYHAGSNPNTVGIAPISCASAMGVLIITSQDTDVLRVSYNPGGPSISIQSYHLQIRDFIGVDDSLAVDNRPVALTDVHKYNLYNQGWYDAGINPYFTADAVYPSNAQTWGAGKDATGAFVPALLDKMDFGKGAAPKGRFVLNTSFGDRNSVSGIGSISSNTQFYRPTSCAFFAGRAWYAGWKSNDFSSWVFFSQVADVVTKLGACFQNSDPTSQDVSELVASDGGYIPIQGAGTILRIVPVFNAMLVFADNGVWAISGGPANNFSASSYEVRKITSVGCSSATSIVETDVAVFFWTLDGIWSITPNQSGGMAAQSITLATIQSFYAAIPATGRSFSQGTYYAETKTVYWAFNSNSAQDGINYRFKKNRLLCLDLRLGAFYTMTVSPALSLSPYFVAVAITKSKSITVQTDQVIDHLSNIVIDHLGNNVINNAPKTPHNTEVRFLVVAPGSVTSTLTFGCFREGLTTSAAFSDWFIAGGARYASYVLTGFDLGAAQGGDHEIQGLYITVFMKRTELGVDPFGGPFSPSSCTFQSRWDWTSNSVPGKWSPGEEVYRHKREFLTNYPISINPDGYPVVVTKSKVRGRGRAVQFMFTADPAKDMKLIGWAIPFLGNTNV